jgi:hypothetical protein
MLFMFCVSAQLLKLSCLPFHLFTHWSGLMAGSNCSWCVPGKYQTGSGLIAEVNCTWCIAGKYQSGSGFNLNWLILNWCCDIFFEALLVCHLVMNVLLYHCAMPVYSCPDALYDGSCIGQVWLLRITAHCVLLESTNLDQVQICFSYTFLTQT